MDLEDRIVRFAARCVKVCAAVCETMRKAILKEAFE